MSTWRMRWRVIVLVAAGWLGSAGIASAADRPIDAFFGRYEGQTISETAEGLLGKRDLGVMIEPTDTGFRLSWTTIVRRPDGTTKRKDYTIDFQPSDRGGIYASAMRKDLFGNRLPLDPLKGDPYIWARINGETLSVYALLVNDAGGFEMQVYDRTLTPEGLDLRFSRFADGWLQKMITGTLSRTDR